MPKPEPATGATADRQLQPRLSRLPAGAPRLHAVRPRHHPQLSRRRQPHHARYHGALRELSLSVSILKWIGSDSRFALLSCDRTDCRGKLVSSTRSKSLSTSRPTPLVPRYSAAGQPSPPKPTMSTRARRAWPGLPRRRPRARFAARSAYSYAAPLRSSSSTRGRPARSSCAAATRQPWAAANATKLRALVDAVLDEQCAARVQAIRRFGKQDAVRSQDRRRRRRARAAARTSTARRLRPCARTAGC